MRCLYAFVHFVGHKSSSITMIWWCCVDAKTISSRSSNGQPWCYIEKVNTLQWCPLFQLNSKFHRPNVRRRTIHYTRVRLYASAWIESTCSYRSEDECPSQGSDALARALHTPRHTQKQNSFIRRIVCRVDTDVVLYCHLIESIHFASARSSFRVNFIQIRWKCFRFCIYLLFVAWNWNNIRGKSCFAVKNWINKANEY